MYINIYVLFEVLKEKFELFLVEKDVVGFFIVICLDCLLDDVVEYLVDLNKCIYFWVEFGL